MAHHPDCHIVLMPMDVQDLIVLQRMDVNAVFMQKLTALPSLPAMDWQQKEQLSFALRSLALGAQNLSSTQESIEWSMPLTTE